MEERVRENGRKREKEEVKWNDSVEYFSKSLINKSLYYDLMIMTKEFPV